MCKPVSLELCVGSGRALEGEMTPEHGQQGEGHGAGAEPMGDSRDQVAKVTGIKRLF